jgi:hypothetical protein
MSDMKPPRCSRCGRGMERGLIMDRGHAGKPTTPSWVEGQPEPSFFRGLKTKGKEQHEVVTFRCPGCGYLESYAPA